jgi:hypothetical protein
MHGSIPCVPLFLIALAGQTVTQSMEDLMCHNHSHLVAEFLGEDTSNSLPVLTYQLASSDLKVESPYKGGGSLTVTISGLLRVPSLMLGGYSPRLQRQTVADGMSLFCLPEGASTTILEAVLAWLNASPTSLDPSPASELPPTATPKSDDWRDRVLW